jgi:YesN/AraC family two-component response regulator
MSAAQIHVRRMLNRIEQSYSEPITLHWLAAELHRQEAQLGAMFRHEVGVPMRECLTRVRLDHAAALIREGLKVEAVSMLVDTKQEELLPAIQTSLWRNAVRLWNRGA